jgi:SAM-dependent methyltransferase
MNFKDLKGRKRICLYAGDLPNRPQICKKYQTPFIGLSLHRNDNKHIRHDIRNQMSLSSNSVDVYQSEDVFEHIDYNLLLPIVNEVYRVLKRGGLFRLSVPDYRCDVLYNRCKKDGKGRLLHDPRGGGYYHVESNSVKGGGHVWFPVFETVGLIFRLSHFKNYTFLHYYDTDGKSITDTVDYDWGSISRTPDFVEKVQNPYRAWSIIVDAWKR